MCKSPAAWIPARSEYTRRATLRRVRVLFALDYPEREEWLLVVYTNFEFKLTKVLIKLYPSKLRSLALFSLIHVSVMTKNENFLFIFTNRWDTLSWFLTKLRAFKWKIEKKNWKRVNIYWQASSMQRVESTDIQILLLSFSIRHSFTLKFVYLVHWQSFPYQRFCTSVSSRWNSGKRQLGEGLFWLSNIVMIIQF